MGLGRFMGFGLDLWIMALWIYGAGFGLDWIDGFSSLFTAYNGKILYRI